MEPGRISREWLEALGPAEFLEISSMILDIQRERAEARRRKREERRTDPAREGGRAAGATSAWSA